VITDHDPGDEDADIVQEARDRWPAAHRARVAAVVRWFDGPIAQLLPRRPHISPALFDLPTPSGDGDE
jgi:hypothetical protein